MKSSSSLQLTLMVGAAATLSACSESPQTFASVADCVRYGKPQGLCQATYDEALATHVRSAPIFDSNEECQARVDVDRCVGVKVSQGGGTPRTVFAPMMAAFRTGPNVTEKQDEGSGGGGSGGGGYFYNRSRYHGEPIYRSRRHPDGYWTASEMKTSGSQSAFRQPNIRTQTLARQGFGGRSLFGGG
ncbi:DUF1190 domain-containing protein [Microvirga subterranea]|uniref:Uncharacterized protein YgiB involved in biofilm formation n=1 Tax=Microvirga subterranea TaxID=186651 RepID=A0A370HQR6_9HYPH|nr:DUF1190 domain-containing protein [Microvirga subterranea]RDI60889.1 uncharacterized protein YgiB involved in biofilm formation [Microvirga subterranea]